MRMGIENMRPLTHARINGHKITLLIDTCATRSFINYDWLIKNHISLSSNFQYEFVNGSYEYLYSCFVDLEIANRIFSKVNIIARKTLNWDLYEFDGCIGMDLLIGMPFTLNLINRELSHWGVTDIPLGSSGISHTVEFFPQIYPGVPNAKVYVSAKVSHNIKFDTGCQKSSLSKFHFPDIKIDKQIPPIAEIDSRNRRTMKYTAEKSVIIFNGLIIQPDFKPFITYLIEDEIIGIDAFNGFVIQYLGNYRFNIIGVRHFNETLQ